LLKEKTNAERRDEMKKSVKNDYMIAAFCFVVIIIWWIGIMFYLLKASCGCICSGKVKKNEEKYSY